MLVGISSEIERIKLELLQSQLICFLEDFPDLMDSHFRKCQLPL